MLQEEVVADGLLVEWLQEEDDNKDGVQENLWNPEYLVPKKKLWP